METENGKRTLEVIIDRKLKVRSSETRRMTTAEVCSLVIGGRPPNRS